MTSEEQKKLRIFEARVRQLMLEFQNQQETIASLQSEISQREEEIVSLTSQVCSLKQRYNNLQMAKFMEISDGDIKAAKQRMTRLVREVNRCIRLLNAEEIVLDVDKDTEGQHLTGE